MAKRGQKAGKRATAPKRAEPVRVRYGGNLAVLFLDLDGFKGVNHTLGHPIGDLLLRAVTGRLLGCIGEQDKVARLGGDEFAVLQVTSEGRDEAAGLAHLLLNAVGAPYNLDGHEVIIGTSIGVAFAPSDGIDPEELLKKADMALYQAKSDGRGVFRFFRPEIEASQQARHVVELELHKALAESQFELFRADLGCYPLMPCRKSPSYTYRAGTVLGLAKRALEACNLMPEWATIYGRPGRR
jgi:diguanylate cyclase (GGDEF)-like protein